MNRYVLGVIIGLFISLLPSSVGASSTFNAGRIIDDSVMSNYGAMNPTQIQSFLNARTPVCDTWGTKAYGGTTRAQYAASVGVSTPFTCLKDYSENGRAAAQIIYDVGVKYRINPQVLLVLLQKEQGLVTDDWPWPVQYRSATGYGCPDTAPCDAQYYGLTNQLDWSAKMFRAILDNSPNWYTPYILGNNYIQYNPNASCGGSTVNIQNRATQALYNYTPYQPNPGALAAGWGTAPCGAYGNRNFFLYFNEWFGSTTLPSVFKGNASGTVYVSIAGYKVAIPTMYLLQDLGYDPGAISVVEQSLADSVTLPSSNSGISSSLTSLIKTTSDTDADGGAVYVVTVGKKYPITSMEQFNSFGFSTNNISYVPSYYLESIPSDSALSNFIRTPDNSIFLVANAGKSLIFDGAKYNALNPSGYYSPVSSAIAAGITSSNPQGSNPVFIKKTDGAGVYAYRNGQYLSVPDMDTFKCWGINSVSGNGLGIIESSYLPAAITTSSSLSCKTLLSDGKTYLLSGDRKYNPNQNYGINGGQSIPSEFEPLISNIPSATLKQAVKGSSSTIWYLEGGQRKPIPSMSNFSLIDSSLSYDTLSDGALTTLQTSSIKLATGQVVKTSDSGSVYVINGSAKIAVASSQEFESYKWRWTDIETYSSNDLSLYSTETTNLGSFFTATNNQTYIFGPTTCYSISQSLLGAYNTSPSANLARQTYSTNLFPYLSLSGCQTASAYVKSATRGTVYKLESGSKRAINSWAKLVDDSGTSNPSITTITDNLLDSYPLGSNL